MATERFYRLPEEKQRLIRDAAIRELIRVPFDKVSINQIIKNANISRGSFYTYFEDKWDLVRYIFQDIKEYAERICQESLERTSGDYWELLSDLWKSVFLYVKKNHLFQLARNLMGYSDTGERFPFFPGDAGKNMAEREEEEIWLFEHIDHSGLKIKTIQEFRPFHALCMSTIAVAMSQIYMWPEQQDDVEAMLRKKWEIIRYGVCEEQGRCGKE